MTCSSGTRQPDELVLSSLPLVLLRLPIGQARSEDGGRYLSASKGTETGGESDLEASGLQTLVWSPRLLLKSLGAITVGKG